jgi:hypothetical protein
MDMQDRLSTYPARCKIGEDEQWTFPATGQVTSFPIVRKRLIPGRLQNTIHTTFGTQFPFLELVVILFLFSMQKNYKWKTTDLPSNQPGDSLFIFNAEELEIKDDGPFEQRAR